MPKSVRSPMPPAPRATFDDVVVPHLDAALRLARWLTRNEHDAKDVVQEASLRAFRYFRTFNGGDGRAWFLRIVRNTCSSYCRRRRDRRMDAFDERHHLIESRSPMDPESSLTRADEATRVVRALRTLPDALHQLLVLREFEGLSYRELADEIGVPIGTVMSRLSRGREALRDAFNNEPAASRRVVTPMNDEKLDVVLT